METFEEALGTGSMETSTSGTGLGSVLGVDSDSQVSLSKSLILDEALQLEEAPRVQPEIKPLSPSLLPDIGQLLHHDYAPFAGIANDFLADVVIHPSHKPFLSARDLPKKPLSSTSAFGLELPSQSCILDSFGLDHFTIEEPSLAGHCKVIDSDINTNPLFVAVCDDFDVVGNSDIEEESILPVNHVSRADLPLVIFPEIVRDACLELDPSVDCGERQNAILEAEASCIIPDGKELPEDRLLSFSNTCSEGITCSVPAGADKLCGKLSHLSDGAIGQIMQFPLVMADQFPSAINDLLGRFGILPHGLKELRSLWNLQLYSSNRPHSNYSRVTFKKPREVKRQFLPFTSKGVSLLQSI